LKPLLAPSLFPETTSGAMECTGEELASLVQALGAVDALGNLKVGELKAYCKQHGVATSGNKLAMITVLSKQLMAKFGTAAQEDPSSSGTCRSSMKRPAAAIASDMEPPSSRARGLVKQHPAAAEAAVDGAANSSLAPNLSGADSQALASSSTGTRFPGGQSYHSMLLDEYPETFTVQELRQHWSDLDKNHAAKKTEPVHQVIPGSPKAVLAPPRQPVAMPPIVASCTGTEGSQTMEFRPYGNDTTADVTVSSSICSARIEVAGLCNKAMVLGQEKPSAKATPPAPDSNVVQADAGPPAEEGTLTMTAKVRDVFMKACGDMMHNKSKPSLQRHRQWQSRNNA